MPQKLSPDLIAAAIEGFEYQKSQIDSRIAELRSMLPGAKAGATSPSAAPVRRRLSAAARRKIALAQKARWARVHREAKPAAPASAPAPKHRISEEGLKRIAAATKKRWALKRAAAAAAKPAAKKAIAAKKAPAKKAAVKKTAAKKQAPARKAVVKPVPTPEAAPVAPVVA